MAAESESSSDERLSALESRVAEMEGYRAILDLKSRYGTLADARYTRKGPKPQPKIDAIADEMAALFTEDAVWEGGGSLGTATGREEIRERFCSPTLQYSWHFFVKPAVRVEGLNAFGTWDVLAMMTTKEERALWMVGVEHDEYRFEDGAWLHSKMRLDSQLMAPYDRGWSGVGR